MSGTEGHCEALQLDNYAPAFRERVAARLRDAGVPVTDDGQDLFVATDDLLAAMCVVLAETGRQRARRRQRTMLAGAGAAVVVVLVVGVGAFVARLDNRTQGGTEAAAALAVTEGSASCVDPVGDQIAGAVQAPRPASRADSADVVAASIVASGDTVQLTATFVEPPVLAGTATYASETATSAGFKLYIDADRWYSVSATADTPAPRVEAYYGDPDDSVDTFKDLNPPQDATWESNSLTVRIPLDLLDELPETFNWSLLTLVFEDLPQTGDMATGSSLAMDQCGTSEPVPPPSEATAEYQLRFPGSGGPPTVPDEDPIVDAPAEPSTTTAGTPPVEQVDRSSHAAVAAHLIDAWNSNDSKAAAEVAPPDVVELLFAESRNTPAELSGCRHSSEIGPDEFQLFATFVCEGTFGADWASDQSIEVYVDGGASGGYDVTAVSFNRNPPGWQPID